MHACSCASFLSPDAVELFMGSSVSAFTTLKDRGQPHWWLSLRHCEECDQYWLVAQEERLNDLYILERVSHAQAQDVLLHDRWPGALDTYEELLQTGKACGYSARYADPDATLAIAIDLAGQRPDISAQAFADLVNIQLDDAIRVLDAARQEIARSGYPCIRQST